MLLQIVIVYLINWERMASIDSNQYAVIGKTDLCTIATNFISDPHLGIFSTIK